jgi:hypothetical protein
LLANYKLAFVNGFLRRHRVKSVIDFGCGDGAQIRDLACRHYLGIDISVSAVEQCRATFAHRTNWSFEVMRADAEYGPKRGVALSLDVIYHLVEDEVFERYMFLLFSYAKRFVIIYSSDSEERSRAPHIRHRWHSGWVARNLPEWTVVRRGQTPYPFHLENSHNTSFADFTIYGLNHR